MRFLILITVVVALSCTAQRQQEPRDLFHTAMVQALQMNLTETVSILQNIPLDKLNSEEREVAETVINRFSSLTFQFDESKYREYPEMVRSILSAYQEYLFNVLLNKIERDVANSQFLETLVEITQMPPVLDDSLLTELNILVFTGERLEELGFHHFLDSRNEIFDFMILKTQYEEEYEVELPVGTELLTVVFLDDFITFGWIGFATADYYHVGGWVMPDKIYCVKPSYDINSETFLISYLVHETQHFQDYRLFPHMENAYGIELEYRAKLAEIIMGKEIVMQLLNSFELNQSDDENLPHPYANRILINNLRTRLSLPENSKWENIELSEIQVVARQLLSEDTMRLVQLLKE